jgi:hypothetical protein
MYSSLRHRSTYVTSPLRLVPQGKGLTRVISLIAPWERDSFRFGIPVAADFDVEAVCVVLRPAAPDWLRCDVVAVQRQKLGPKDIEPGLDIAGDGKCLRVAVFVDKILIGPLLCAY